ncbi:hypothetical protein CGRA01v4_06760 [Colletotrichum graminicola]|nr:hypothetical protein CGRA01v4_06760 [Colletotrichum graminicola]
MIGWHETHEQRCRILCMYYLGVVCKREKEGGRGSRSSQSRVSFFFALMVPANLCVLLYYLGPFMYIGATDTEDLARKYKKKPAGFSTGHNVISPCHVSMTGYAVTANGHERCITTTGGSARLPSRYTDNNEPLPSPPTICLE